jgi:hypothetical protein
VNNTSQSKAHSTRSHTGKFIKTYFTDGMNGERGGNDGNFNEEGQNSICGARDGGNVAAKARIILPN